MIKCEGYQMFNGTMLIKYLARPEEYVTGSWLYKPDSDCWYCKGCSYPANICTILNDYDADSHYKCGLFVGRFQPFHRGHEYIVKKMLEDCETVLICIGSIQEYRSMKNPFTYEERFKYIRDTFPNTNVHIVGITDRKAPSDDASWGKYILRGCALQGYYPDVVYQGEEDKHNEWFEESKISIVNVPRNEVNISATDVRDALLNGDKSKFKSLMPYTLHHYYNYMHEVVTECFN